MSFSTNPAVQNSPSASARPVSPLLYPILLVAGISVIIASLLGMAAMTGLLPQAQSQSQPVTPAAKSAATARADKAPQPAAAAKPAAVRKPETTTAAVRCDTCGVVESVRAIESGGEGSGLGAVAGGVVGGILGNQVGGGRGRTAMTVVGAGAGAYAGHELEKNMKRSVSYEIRVRMDDSSYRTIRTEQPAVGVGQRVNVRDGRVVAAG